MSEDSSFLGRWSRRKQAAARPAAPASEPALEEQPVLPDIATLGPGSDYAAFMQKGVSALVQQQALARAWTSDTGIATFRGMADYDWDFNAAGYGRLALGDNVASLLRAVLEPGEQEPGADVEPGTVPETVPGTVPEPAMAVRVSEAVVDLPEVAVAPVEPIEPPPRRRHGGALPS